MTDRETLDVYDAKAQEYDTCFCAGAGPGEQLQSFLDHVPAGSDLLDLGCGPGRSAEKMAAAGHRVIATDASAEMVKLAATRAGVTARQEVFDDLTAVDAFDGIWANFSLLHADEADLPRYLAAIAAALRQGGIFHIGMKIGDGMHRDGIGRRYTYVTETGLKDALAAIGLQPFAEWTGEDKGLAGTVDPWIVLQARKIG